MGRSRLTIILLVILKDALLQLFERPVIDVGAVLLLVLEVFSKVRLIVIVFCNGRLQVVLLYLFRSLILYDLRVEGVHLSI